MGMNVVASQLPKEWQTLALEKTGDVVYGIQAAVANNIEPIGTKILTNKNITLDGQFELGKLNYFKLTTPRHKATILESGDILFNWRSGSIDHVGKTAIFRLSGEYVHSSFILRIRPFDTVSNDYLFYYLRFLRESGYYARMHTYAINAKFNKSAVNALPVVLPSLPEQKRIAHILSTVQWAIEAQTRIIQTTTELKKALMHKLFTEGIRNEPQKQTEIGPVPESWEVVPLVSVVRSKLQNGAFVKKPQNGNGFLFANVVDMYRETHLDLSKLERLDVPAESIAQYWLEDGDILVVRSSLKREGIGQNCVTRNLTESVFYDCHLIRVQTDSQKLIPEFLSAFWRSDKGKNDLILRSKTTTMTTINQQGVSKALVPIPSTKEQSEIVKHIDIIDINLRNHRIKKIHLEDLFRTLLHELMTAKTRVHELDL